MQNLIPQVETEALPGPRHVTCTEYLLVWASICASLKCSHYLPPLAVMGLEVVTDIRQLDSAW